MIAVRRTGAVCVAKRPGTTTPGTRSSGVGLGPQLWYVSFGAELRGSYEVYRNYNWGSGSQDGNGYYLNRLIGHADFHLGSSVRIFAELQSGLEFGRNGGPRPAIDEDKLDVSQLFLELRVNPTAQNSNRGPRRPPKP